MNRFLLICFLFASVHSFSQNEKEWGLEIKPKAGILIAHRGVMAHIPNAYPKAIELSVFFKTKGNQSWNKPYKYPIIGASVFAGSVGNAEMLGNFYGIYSFIDLPFIRKSRYTFSSRLASGLGYGTKVYDPELNPKNAAISTHFNALICLGLKQTFLFGKNHLSMSFDITHFSNGANKTPNLGLNLPYIGIGYGRIFNQTPNPEVEQSDIFEKRKSINVTAIYSRKQVFPSGGRTYSIYALNANFRKIFTEKTGFESGIDLISKQTILDYKEITKSQSDIWQMGAYAAYVLPFDNFHIVVGMGAYVRDKYNPDDLFYHRIGMRYETRNRILFNLTLKSHWAKADYVEWGIGYSF